MSPRFWTIILIALGVALGYYHQFGGTPFTLGLDLKGGTELLYRADISRLTPGDVDTSLAALRDVIERRVNIFGVSEPVVQNEKSGTEQRLLVQLPGVTDITEAVESIGATYKIDNA